jgi:PAS domain-containing protein
VPPAVHVERVVVDGAAQPATQLMQLPAGAQTVEIDYSGIGLLAPEKVVFQYMLEGYDRGWIDAGTRRTAFYTKLPPGRYSFRVIARSADGAWNRTGAAISIRQRGFFYQLPAFMGIVLIATALGLVRVHRLRVRHLVRRIAELGGNVAERTVQLREKGDRLAALGEQLSAAHERIDRANQAMVTSLGQVRAGVAIAGGDGGLVFASESARRLLSLDDSALGRAWTSAFPFDDDDRAELRRLVELPAAQRTKVHVIPRSESGRRQAIEVEVRDDPRDTTGRIFYFYDVSDVHELRERLDAMPTAPDPATVQPGNGHGAHVEDLPTDRPERSEPEPAAPAEIFEGDERQRFEEALRRAGGNRAEAARLLGIARSTFYRRLKALAAEAQTPEEPPAPGQ